MVSHSNRKPGTFTYEDYLGWPEGDGRFGRPVILGFSDTYESAIFAGLEIDLAPAFE